MLRTALRSQLRFRPSASAYARNFVSTALLTKTWETETANDLRQEAKKRGLSAKGNKATLITRLQHDDEQKAIAPAPSSPSPQQQQVRHASTTEVPGIPPTGPPPVHPKEFMNIHIPDVSQPEPLPETPIPLLPDLWDSSRIRAESERAAPAEPSQPKVIAVAGAVTHPGGGPSHNLYTEDVIAEPAPTNMSTGFWSDVAHDLNIPTSFNLSPPHAGYDVHETTSTSGAQERSHSRTLDKDEVRGIWLLLGLLAGSWLAGGWFQLPSAFVEKAEEVAEQAEGKAAGKH
ncbi:hypothetical protein BKA93DRAFT_829001 [Sparassis latifolia]|uniref:SAP domain-containing protein n=1 Tax=Sparassis crispa TaxID=139825 RepID=A0A401GIB7_9APHY|nr:predicted protein [Sparassis crispa]GBE81936.1 predicted protein [Sparassis crispa]